MNASSESAADALAALARQQLPRLLTQVCRDPGSPFYGCFDRNWWHYKIRDFPSIILQQGAYALWTASLLPEFSSVAPTFRELAAAGCRFWNRRALRHRAFEEYYPWEEGYPPLAFSTLSVMKLVAGGVVSAEDMRAGAKVAAHQLSTRFEHQAANQQVAGLAALAWIRLSYPEMVTPETFANLSRQTLSLQRKEGWFVEYDGPDLGYLAVTIDCLWDLFDATGDHAYVDSARRARDFINSLVLFFGGGIGMHNSRNTDYLVPYGLARFLSEEDCGKEATRQSFILLFKDSNQPDHFFAAIDDRYWSHYIGHSLFRALKILPQLANSPSELLPGKNKYPEAGYQLIGLESGTGRAFVSLKKGGIFTLKGPEGCSSDFGWVVDFGNRSWVSHWWSENWNLSSETGLLKIEGFLKPHRETISDPFKHAALRLGSFVLGRNLIQFLKKQLIFKNQTGTIGFSRTIRFESEVVRVQDRLSHLPANSIVRRAPRSSKRHVASADSWHLEDTQLNHGFVRTEKIARNQYTFSAVTEYPLTPQSGADSP